MMGTACLTASMRARTIPTAINPIAGVWEGFENTGRIRDLPSSLAGCVDVCALPEPRHRSR